MENVESESNVAFLKRIRAELSDSGVKLGVKRQALKDVTDEVRLRSLYCIENGITEAETARLAGVAITTVRAWQGKS